MPISKGEFARRRGVTAGRVSQWLAEGKISGAAIVGEGRNAQIDEDLAVQQLGLTLNPDQRHSGNGLGTNLTTPQQPGNSLEQQLLEERLEKARRENRAAAIQEAVANGQLCDTAEARLATGRIVALIVARLDGSLPEIAAAISAEFKLPQRDVLHLLKREWRRVRQAASIEEKERAEPMPATVGYELADGA